MSTANSDFLKLSLPDINSQLKTTPQNTELLIQRATLRIRSGEIDLALTDAEQAVLNAKTEDLKIKAQKVRATVLYRLNRKAEAKFLAQNLPAKSLEDELYFHALTSFEGDAVDPGEPQNTKVGDKQPRPTLDTKTQASAIPAQPNYRVDWYQNGMKVYITVFKKQLDTAGVQVEIGESQLVVVSPELDFHWTLNLGHKIVPKECTYEFTPYKVEFVLTKTENKQWVSLETQEEVKKPEITSKETLTSYKKFDKLDLEDDEDNPDEGDPNAFFQELYKNSTPEVQRAMMKSYVESNGTALSTNWDEVSKQKVETCPPEHMEAKKW